MHNFARSVMHNEQICKAHKVLAMTQESARRANRRGRLAQLIAELDDELGGRGGQADLARASGTPKSHLSAILAGRRGLGDELAERLAEICGKPRDWFDRSQADVPVNTAHPPLRGKESFAADVTKSALVPLLTAATVVHMALPNDAPFWAEHSHVRADRGGPVAQSVKAWMVDDSSMLPMLKPGDVVFVDPSVPPAPGKIVLCECAGEVMLREYVAIAGGVFQARALAPGYAALRSDVDGVKVLATKVGMTTWD